MCKQLVLAFYCSRPLIYEGPHIGFQIHDGNSEFNSEERNSDSNSNSNDGNSNSIPIPPVLGKANSNSIPIPELDLELARKSNSGAELTPTLATTTSHPYSQRRNCVSSGNRSIPHMNTSYTTMLNVALAVWIHRTWRSNRGAQSRDNLNPPDIFHGNPVLHVVAIEGRNRLPTDEPYMISRFIVWDHTLCIKPVSFILSAFQFSL